MTADKRRDEITKYLSSQDGAVSASSLAEKFYVSRQVIVGDIAIIRASGIEVAATPKGYIMARAKIGIIKTIACAHDNDRLLDELYAIVDNGCIIIDVIVEHQIYGELSASLQIASRYDADKFKDKLSDEAPPLSALTGGIHLHTISCPDEGAYRRVLEVLREKKILLTENT